MTDHPSALVLEIIGIENGQSRSHLRVIIINIATNIKNIFFYQLIQVFNISLSLQVTLVILLHNRAKQKQTSIESVESRIQIDQGLVSL
jgi:hypothetical protein